MLVLFLAKGRAAFGAWYASAAFREFKLPAEFIRPVTPAEGKTPSYTATETIERALDLVPLEALQQHSVDVPANPGALEE